MNCGDFFLIFFNTKKIKRFRFIFRNLFSFCPSLDRTAYALRKNLSKNPYFLANVVKIAQMVAKCPLTISLNFKEDIKNA